MMEDAEAVLATPDPQFSVLASNSMAARRKEIAAAANTRSRGEKSIQSEKRALRIRARNGLWPSRQVDNQSNQRDQPAQDHDQGSIWGLAARGVFHDPDRDPEPEPDHEQHPNQAHHAASRQYSGGGGLGLGIG
jgi:hypothetical protein